MLVYLRVGALFSRNSKDQRAELRELDANIDGNTLKYTISRLSTTAPPQRTTKSQPDRSVEARRNVSWGNRLDDWTSYTRILASR